MREIYRERKRNRGTERARERGTISEFWLLGCSCGSRSESHVICHHYSFYQITYVFHLSNAIQHFIYFNRKMYFIFVRQRDLCCRRTYNQYIHIYIYITRFICSITARFIAANTAAMYKGTSLIRKRYPVGPYSRTMPRLLWWS